MNSELRVFTVGHSNHPLETFLSLLGKHGVNAVADVRSAPYCKYTPHFNKEEMQAALPAHGIKYVYLGKELGARSDDPACMENGRVKYALLAGAGRFRDGIDRILRGAAEHRIAIMCSEKEPIECHRTLLVARALRDRGVAVDHILADGGLETHRDAMLRLLDRFKMPRIDLFHNEEEMIALAVSRQEERVAYADEEASSDAKERAE